jgi:hypothetical protein
VDVFPSTVPAPAAIPRVDGTPRRKVLGEQAPLAAGAHQVEDAVENLPQVRGRAAQALRLGQERLQQRELLVGEVGFIALSLHTSLYAETDYSHRLLGPPLERKQRNTILVTVHPAASSLGVGWPDRWAATAWRLEANTGPLCKRGVCTTVNRRSTKRQPDSL